GLAIEGDFSKVVLPLANDSILAQAARSGQAQTLFLEQQGDRPDLPFAGAPTCALALPIVVPGGMVAVIYADDSDAVEPAPRAAQARVKFAELLQQHAALVVFRLGTLQKAALELRELAGQLTDDIEYAHAADVEAGKSALDRQMELK